MKVKIRSHGILTCKHFEETLYTFRYISIDLRGCPEIKEPPFDTDKPKLAALRSTIGIMEWWNGGLRGMKTIEEVIL